jgi:quercetin dioxygenase-like cupin family protein
VFTDGAETAFEVRYFEMEPSGYTSFERHRHEHLVVVLRGRGRVRLGSEWHDLAPHDVVRVPADMPHRFEAGADEPFGILCVVDRERDRPELLDPATTEP